MKGNLTMKEDKGQANEVAHLTETESDDVRIGYQTAIQMAVYDGQLSWQVTGMFVQFAILMIAGAVFPSFVGTKDELVISIAGSVVALAGIIMTSMFGSMVMRIRTYEEYWVVSATRLEDYLSKFVFTFKGSVELSKQKSITINKNTVRLKKISIIKSKTMLGALFVCFLLTFFLLLCINIWRFILAI